MPVSPLSPATLTNSASLLLDSLSTAVLLVDNQLLVRYANPASEQLLTLSAKRLVANPLATAFLHSTLRLELLRDTLANGHSFTDNDVVLVMTDGHHATVDVTATPLEHGQQRFALLEFKQTDQQKKISKEAQQVAQQQAARELVRSLAHEIKNPLGGLRGAAQLLEKELPDPQLRDFTRIIIEQADRLRNLVDRLLGPQKPTSRAPHNIHMVLEKVRQLMTLDLPAGVTISRDYDPSIPDLPMDAEQIEQALLNIVKNGVEALQSSGELKLITRSSNQYTLHGERHRLVAEIKIIDSGPGIAAELKDTLFYPMVTTKPSGSGLGLSIAQTLVNQHGGRIDCVSWPGHTEFTLILPIRK